VAHPTRTSSREVNQKARALDDADGGIPMLGGSLLTYDRQERALAVTTKLTLRRDGKEGMH